MGLFITGFGAAFFSWLGSAVTDVPESVAVSFFAFFVGALSIAYAIRTEIHIEHLVRTRSRNGLHILVVALEILVTFAFLAAAPFLLSDPDGVAACIYAGAIVVPVIALGVAMSWLNEHFGIKTGTEVASHCWFTRALRWLITRFDHYSFFRWLNSLWDRNAPSGRVSYLVLWISAGLVAVAAANGPPVYKALSHHAPKVKKKAREKRGSSPKNTAAEASGKLPDADRVEESEPDLEQLCGDLLDPGEPAPEPARSLIYSQWLGLGGLGAIFAGCPKPAHQLADGLWYAAGTCHGDLRSLALAPPGAQSGAILLWGPARFALAAAEAGELKSATSSRLADEGEFYTVDTVAGTVVFIREEVSDGESKYASTPRDCADIREDPVPFVKLPPALTRLWFSQIQYDGVWIWPTAEASTEGGVEITFRSTDPSDEREIAALCSSGTDCELRVEGVTASSSGVGGIDVGRLLEIAPPDPTTAP